MITGFLGEVVNIAKDFATGGVAGVVRGLATRHGAQLKAAASGTAHGIGAFIQGAKNDFGKFGKSFSQAYQQQSIDANTPGAFSSLQFNPNAVAPGRQHVSAGQAFDQSMKGDINYNITVTDSANPRETAKHVVKEINKRTPLAQRQGGSSNTPWLPTLPGLMPQHA